MEHVNAGRGLSVVERVQHDKKIRQVIRLNYDQSGGLRQEGGHGEGEYTGVLSNAGKVHAIRGQIHRV